MGLETSIIDLWHYDYLKSQLRFSLLNSTLSVASKLVPGKNKHNTRFKQQLSTHSIFY